MTFDASSLLGVWKLDDYVVELEDGRTIKPWGDNFLGYTLITDGFMSSSMARTNDDIDSVKYSFFSYSGSIEFEGDDVIISVVICSEPSWIGIEQKRRILIDDNKFTAITPNMEWEGISGINKLVWKRV